MYLYNRLSQHLTKLSKKSPNVVTKQSYCSSKTCDVPYEEICIPVPWGNLAGKWWGPKDKKPIFTFHGWLDNCGTFDLLIPQLPKHLSYLAIDYPGHGYSSQLSPGTLYDNRQGSLLIRYIQSYFKFEKIALMGHSLGSITNYSFAGLFPQAVDFLICIDGLNPPIHPHRVPSFAKYIDAHWKYDAQNSRFKGAKEPTVHSMEAWIEFLHIGTRCSLDIDKCKYSLTRNLTPSGLHPGKFYFSVDPRAKVGTFLNWPLEDLIEHARRIKFPMLATKAGELSLAIRSDELYMTIKKIIMNGNLQAEFYNVTGTHFGHLNTPELYSEIISRFLEKYADTCVDIDKKIFESIRQ